MNTSVPSPWSKGCCGGRKTRSNSRPTLFFSYLSNGEESAKKDHVNEFKGSKNGGKEVWVGLRWSENTKIRRPKFMVAPPSPARSRRIPRRLARKFHRRGRLVVLLLPGQRMYSSCGRNRLPRLKPYRPKNVSKRPSWGFSGFWDFLSGFGVGSSLGTQN